jgi:hypothetical protein
MNISKSVFFVPGCKHDEEVANLKFQEDWKNCTKENQFALPLQKMQLK